MHEEILHAVLLLGERIRCTV